MSENTFKEPEVIAEPEKVEEAPVKKVKKKKKENAILKGIQSVLDGTILTKELVVKSLPFIFYITFLAILYIANSNYSEKKIMEIEKVKKEIKELRSESISVKSKLMYYSRQTEVIKRIGVYGIKESVKPPHKIYVVNDSTKNHNNKK